MEASAASAGGVVNHNNSANRTLLRRWIIQVSALSDLMVGFWPTVAMTGNGELGFDSGEGA